jgi:hypothetical protein
MLTDKHGHKQPYDVARKLAEKNIREQTRGGTHAMGEILWEAFGFEGMLDLYLDNVDWKDLTEWAVDEETECFGNYEEPSIPLNLGGV